ncbi:hypothetical protein [Polycladomyces subterraneus]|uniref:Ferric oxidoreductase domain-containing protein n=1 Tax=Polycladomyces subterraneus TaxID=1016997 RepID=A0ABT8IKW7_9BACL|nr:hypothetical protein [Polycladomyces subterraneus]MDN4592799.1 hypothetical protein [Polycladomyces subterraneus]
MITASVISVATVLFAVWLIPAFVLPSHPLHTLSFDGLQRNFGSVARIGFFFTVSIYPVFLLIRYRLIPSGLRPWWQRLSIMVRQWHVPIALLAAGVVTIHAYLALLNGFRINGVYLTGVLVYVWFIVLGLFGFLRYRGRDKQWHLILGLLFVVLFMVHAMVS